MHNPGNETHEFEIDVARVESDCVLGEDPAQVGEVAGKEREERGLARLEGFAVLEVLLGWRDGRTEVDINLVDAARQALPSGRETANRFGRESSKNTVDCQEIVQLIAFLHCRSEYE